MKHGILNRVRQQASLLMATLFLILPLSSPVLAWDQYGHMLVAELAIEKLEPATQRKLESLAYKLVRQQDSDKRLYLIRNFKGSSAFAQLAVIADYHRSLSLADLYQTFGSGTPVWAADYPAEFMQQNSSNWHYRSRAFMSQRLPGLEEVNPQICDLSEPMDVVKALALMEGALTSASSEENQILALALLVHLVGDAHQPLHSISRVDGNCLSDIGGNRFCAQRRSGSLGCRTNLHALWDSGVGIAEKHETLADAADYVRRVQLDETAAGDLDPETWLEESYGYARFIYSIKEGEGADDFYVDEAQIIAFERIALAATRLAGILERVF